MEKKSFLLVGVVMTLVTTGALALLFVVMKPSGIKESEQAGDGAFRFPDKGSNRPLPNSLPPPVSPSSMPPAVPPPAEAEPSAPAQSGTSSLGMITKDPAGTKRPVDGSTAEPGAEAAEAAARGDATGIASALKRSKNSDAPPVGNSADSATRKTLQVLVDLVHDELPDWYDEFLAKKELKRIADAYDDSRDLPMFVVQLAESSAFNKMLSAKAGKGEMRSLVSKIFGKKKLAKDLRTILSDNANDENLLGMIRKFGKKCGLPKDILAKAETAAPGAARSGRRGRTRPGPSRRRRPRSGVRRPSQSHRRLRFRRLGREPSSMQTGQGQGQADPANIDVRRSSSTSTSPTNNAARSARIYRSDIRANSRATRSGIQSRCRMAP